MSAEPQGLHHLLERHAARRPGDLAIIDGDERIDYGGALAATRRLADRLTSAGVRPGDRVGLYLPPGRDEITSIFAVSAVGAVFVPIHPSLRPMQVRHIVDDAEARCLVTTEGAWRRLRGVLDSHRHPTSVLRIDAPSLVRPAPAGAGSPAPAGLAAILYTSGSSGLPKGVMLSHANLLAGSRIVCRYLAIEPRDRLLNVLPLSFDYGLNQLITAVDRGATIVPWTVRFGDEIVAALARHRITGVAGVPSLWTLLTRSAPALATAELPRLRYLTNSGGALPRATLDRLRQLLPRTEIYLMYGLTEAFRSTFLPPSEVDRRPGSIGRAVPETEIFVVSDDGRRCGPGEVGELVHDGPTVALGYWRREEDTAAVFRPHPFAAAGRPVCYSGDRVTEDKEGYLYFVGRADAMIKSRGFRVSPTEVERVLLETGQLSEVAVIGLADPLYGQRIHAVAVPSPELEPSADELLALCDRELPSHMRPCSLELVAALPRLANGKTDYARLVAER